MNPTHAHHAKDAAARAAELSWVENPSPSRPEIPMPDGPALLYVWSDGLTASVVDQGGIPDGARGPRERAILRALLTVALDDLDAAEVSR